jgi:hypothetical protein
MIVGLFHGTSELGWLSWADCNPGVVHFGRRRGEPASMRWRTA